MKMSDMSLASQSVRASQALSGDHSASQPRSNRRSSKAFPWILLSRSEWHASVACFPGLLHVNLHLPSGDSLDPADGNWNPDPRAGIAAAIAMNITRIIGLTFVGSHSCWPTTPGFQTQPTTSVGDSAESYTKP